MKQKENDSKELENRYVNKKGKIKELIKNHYETILLKWLYQKEDIKDDEQEVLDQITSDSNSSEKNYKMMRVKKGTLYILSNDETDPFSQGFNIQLKTPSSVGVIRATRESISSSLSCFCSKSHTLSRNSLILPSSFSTSTGSMTG